MSGNETTLGDGDTCREDVRERREDVCEGRRESPARSRLSCKVEMDGTGGCSEVRREQKYGTVFGIFLFDILRDLRVNLNELLRQFLGYPL
jgi:hypothetical protein